MRLPARSRSCSCSAVPVIGLCWLGLVLLAGLVLRGSRLIGWFVASAVVSTIVLGGALFAWVIWAFSNWKA